MKLNFHMEGNMFIDALFLFVHSHFTKAYRRACLATAVRLLEKVCKGVKLAYYQKSFGVPVTCMNLVASVSDFVHCNKQQVCEVRLISQAVGIPDRVKCC